MKLVYRALAQVLRWVRSFFSVPCVGVSGVSRMIYDEELCFGRIEKKFCDLHYEQLYMYFERND